MVEFSRDSILTILKPGKEEKRPNTDNRVNLSFKDH